MRTPAWFAPCRVPAWQQFVILALLGCSQVSAQNVWSMVYETPWSQADNLNDVDWTAITHLDFVGATPQGNGSLVLTASFATKAPAWIAAAHAHGVKVLLVLGAEDGGTLNWVGAVDNNLTVFVASIMSVVNTYGYDGVDIDWEEAGFTAARGDALYRALRAALGSKLLSAAVLSHYQNAYGSSGQSAGNGNLHQYLDRVNVMTYDLGQANWSVSWFNSPLYRGTADTPWSIDFVMNRYIAEGVPAAKLGIGVPFYGYTSVGGSPSIRGPRQTFGSTPSFSQIGYFSIFGTYDISNPTWDSASHVPWIALTNGWLTFDNERSIREKVEYVLNRGLGGWIIWNLNTDWIQGHNPPHPLLDEVKRAWRGEGSADPCDLDNDGSTDVVDVQLAVNQATGAAACGSADLDMNHNCNIVDVQRIINAALGLGCRSGQ